MKKIRLNLKKISIILSSTLLMAVSSCKFAPDLRTQLKLITEQAEVIGTNLKDYKEYIHNGVYLIPSNEDFTLQIEIRNPQNYQFMNSNTPNGIEVRQIGNYIEYKYSKDYLKANEKSVNDIQPFKIEFTEKSKKADPIIYTCNSVIQCNSKPDSAKNQKMFYTKSTEENPNPKNVFIFDMPVSSNIFEDDKNGDIETIIISANNFDTGKLLYTNEYSLVLEDDNGQKYYSFESKSKTEDLRSRLISAYELTMEGHTPSDVLASFTEDDMDTWNQYSTILFYTPDELGQVQIEYKIKFIDKKGLESISIPIQTEELPKLPSDISLFRNEQSLNNNDKISQDEDSYTSSIYFEIPETIYYMGRKTESGNIECKTKYYDEVSDKSFNIMVSSDGNSCSINTNSSEIEKRFEEWISENQIEPIPETMPSEAVVSYIIKDAKGKDYSVNHAKPREKVILPPGAISLSISIQCTEAKNRNFYSYIDSDVRTINLTVLANTLFAKYIENPDTNNLEFGTEDRPYHAITDAANNLSDPTNENNVIKVLGRLTENISLNSILANNDNKHKVKLIGLVNTEVASGEDQYPIITNSPYTLTIGNNYKVLIKNFTFNGNISIEDNSEVEFEDCIINGDINIGNNSTVEIRKAESRNEITGSIICGNDSTITIENGSLTGNITTNNDSVITISNTEVIGNITTGDAKNRNLVLKVIEASTITGDITIGKSSTALIQKSSIKDITDDNDNTSTAGNITLGETSVLELSGSNVFIEGYVRLADPLRKNDGTIIENGDSYIKLLEDYKPNNKIKLTMDTPVANTTVIDFSQMYNKTHSETTDTKKIRSDISEKKNEYFSFVRSGYYLYLEEIYSTNVIIKPAGINIYLPITDGFEIKGIKESYASGSTITATISNDYIGESLQIVNPKMELLLMGKMITSSKNSLSLVLNYNGTPIPAGNYQLLISFEYDGTVFSKTLPLIITDQ